jgi:hypothetical protein
MEYLNLSFHLFSLLSGAKVQKSFVKNTRMGLKNAICNKKVQKCLELIENVFIFAPSEHLFWLSG